MDITIVRMQKVSDVFDYVATRFDNAVKYGVWHGGKAPLNGGGSVKWPLGRYIGDVMRYSDDVAYPPDPAHTWFASGDRGTDAVSMKWFGPFDSRKEASLWLTGYRKGASNE
jgi:hypothetical protein